MMVPAIVFHSIVPCVAIRSSAELLLEQYKESLMNHIDTIEHNRKHIAYVKPMFLCGSIFI
jgi:hypothetical protein